MLTVIFHLASSCLQCATTSAAVLLPNWPPPARLQNPFFRTFFIFFLPSFSRWFNNNNNNNNYNNKNDDNNRFSVLFQDNAGEPVQQKKTRQFRMLKVPGWLLELCRSRLSMYDYWLACSHHTESQTTARESNIPPQDHFTSDAFPATTLPIYPDLGLAHSTLDCTLRGLATPGLS